jgi:hypothetical protein
VGAEHRALLSDLLNSRGYAFGLEPQANIALASPHGFASDPFADHGVINTHVMLR